MGVLRCILELDLECLKKLNSKLVYFGYSHMFSIKD